MTPSQRQRAVLALFLAPRWRAYGAVCVLSGLVAAAEAAGVFLLIPLFSLLLGSPLPAGGMAGRAAERAIALSPSADPLIGLCLLLAGATLARSVLSLANEMLIGRASASVLHEAKRRLVERWAGASYAYFLDTKKGRMTHLLTVSPLKLSIIAQKLPQVAVECARIAGLALLLLWISPRVMLALAVLGLLLDRLVALPARLSYAIGAGRFRSFSDMSVAFSELVDGIKQITVFGAKEAWLRRFDRASSEFRELFARDSVLLSLPKNVIETAAMLALAGSVAALRLLDPGGAAAALPLLATIAMAGVKILPSLSMASRFRMEIKGALPDIEAIHEALSAPRAAAGGSRPYAGLREGIAFEDVSFRYPSGTQPLRGLALRIHRHRVTALVGDSGAGKTTVVNLLLRLYEPDSGRISVDGTDLRELDARAWLSRIGVVTQDSFVFHGTVAENILFGREGFSRADVERAARTANAHEFISELPEGCETLVGERGMKLSGGQQQRIAIARAVLGDPEILLLDEATSALDNVSERLVQEALAAASKGKTVVQIAHRLSTVREADNIAVLEGGRVAEQGTHSELAARGGAYARFLNRMSAARVDETQEAA